MKTMLHLLGCLILLGAIGASSVRGEQPLSGGDPTDFQALRQNLVRTVAGHALQMHLMLGTVIPRAEIMAAIGNVPRHLFVAAEFRPYAYLDRPIDLGHGQKTAQPYIVALMTELADIKPDAVVYETGTGSGYHAAVLSSLCKQVYSVEIVAPLADIARRNLASQGITNVAVREGDGFFGWADEGPFDAIIIKESVVEVPAPLLRQLRAGGRLVAPIGPPNGPQFLSVIAKDEDGSLDERRVLPVLFTPLQGGERI